MGPDGVSPKVLKVCAEQLTGVYTDIFNLSLTQEVVPGLFKPSIIMPVPKNLDTSTLNDSRPVTFTSVAMKGLKKRVLSYINSVVPDNSVAIALHYTLQHLYCSGTYVRMLFWIIVLPSIPPDQEN